MLLLPAAALAGPDGVDVTMPLVESTVRFLRTKALDPPSEADLLRAGVLRICGDDLSGAGCSIMGALPPKKGASGPEATRAWRQTMESALAAAALSVADFDKTVYQRYIMDAMVEALDDPASFYLLPSVYRKITTVPEAFTGFGLKVAPEKDSLRILAVHAGSPAYEAGLLHGERIVKVNGEDVIGVRRPIALAAIWGADGETVRLSVRRADGSLREARVVYRPWEFSPYSLERRGDFLVVRVRYFDGRIADDLRRELAGTCGGVVLDLRDASAGGDDEMVALADLFLGGGSIGAKRMRDEMGTRIWSAAPSTPGEQLEIPAIVLVNQGTSGLAEVLAMALRRHARALLVGRRTAGLDTQETLMPCRDGSAIQVTSTRLLGPDDGTLTGGVPPHVETARHGVLDLALDILELADGHRLDRLIDAAHRALAPR